MLCVRFAHDETLHSVGHLMAESYRPHWSASQHLEERACRALASMLDAFTEWHDESTQKETP